MKQQFNLNQLAASCKNWKTLVLLGMFLSLGVGQMWAKRVYIDVSWNTDYASKMMVHFWGGTNNKFVYASKCSSDWNYMYYADIDDDATTWQVCRGDGTGSGDSKYNYNPSSGGITFSSYNKIKINGWDNNYSTSSIIGTVTGGHMLFDNSGTAWSDSYKFFVIGHNSHYSTYGGNTSSQVVANTKLWCFNIDAAAWPDAKYFAVIGHGSNYPSADKAWSDIDTYANHKTSQYTSAYRLDDGSIYLCVPGAGTKPALTITYKDGYSALNKTVTIRAKISTDNGSNYSDANTPGALSASAYKFTAWNSCGSTTGTSASLSAGSSTATFTAGYTANTSVEAANADGYTFAGWYEGSTKVLDGRTGTMNPHGAVTLYAYYKANRYTVSFDNQVTLSNSPTASVTATYGVAMPSIATLPSCANYTFGGYYSGKGGSGTIYYNGSGASQRSWNVAGNTTLYAKWTQTVTLDANTSYGGGSDGSAGVVFNGAKTSYSAATPSDGSYALKGYYTAPTGGTEVIDKDGNVKANITDWTDEDGNWIHDGASTLYAQWKTTYTLHYDGNGNTGGTAPDDEEWTMNTTATVASNSGNLVKTNYTFSGWNTSNTGDGTNYTAGSGTFTITANTNLYAKWVETMSALSTGTHYDAGDPSYSAPSVTGSRTTVGYYTTATITAASASTGYTFAGWTLTNCTRTDGGGATANPITIRSNGDGEDVSVVANYTEVLTTSWKLIGDNQSGSPFGDNYSYTNGKAMSKKTGHSTESNAYKTINVTKLPADNYGFKVATSSSDHWGYGTSDGYYIDFNRSASNTSKQVYSGEQHQLRFYPDALGEYEFRVNYPSNKYVYVTFPTAYTVTFGKGTGGSTVTAKYSNVSFSTGTKVQNGKTVTFTQSASSGYEFKEWNTNSSGTGTKLSEATSYDHTVVATNNVYAIFKPKSYDITYNPASPTNFAYTVKPSTGTYNTSVSVTITPNQNYKITSVTANRTGSATSVDVTHTSATNVWSFTQPAYGVTLNVTAASYGLSASISSKSYENRTFNLSKSSTLTPEGTLNTNWFVYYTCTSKPDGASCSINQSTGVATVDKDGDYTFKVQYRTAAAGEGTLLAESSGVTGTMRTIPDYSGLTIGHARYNTTYMGGDGASETPYFIYTSRATTYGKLNLTATLPDDLLTGESLYYSVNSSEIGTVTVDGTAASVTMDLPNKSVGANRTAVIKFYSKLDGQTAPSAKMASATVYYTVSANPVVTISATCDDNPIVGDIPQNATIVVSASATNIPGEPTFVFKKGDGEYSSTTRYTIADAGTTTMYAKTTYLGDDWTNSMTVTTYATNSVTYVLSKTDLYGDDATTSTSRLFKSGGEEHTAPTLDGYTFTGWTCTTSYVEVSDDEGANWKSSSSNATVYVRATAAGGTLTATYTANNRIYFDDTNTGWGSVTVYLFSNNVWHSTMGVQPKENIIEYSTMTRIGESKVYYYEYECSSSDIKYVAFSKHDQHTYTYLYSTKGAYRADFDDCTPVYVSNGEQNDSKNSTNYFSSGYWRRYMPQTAPFSFHLVSPDDVDKGKFEIEHEGVDEENFVKEVELDGNSIYEFNLQTACGGSSYGNTGSMTKDNHTNWTFTQGTSNCHITTTATGIYKFYLSTADGKVKLTVEYPLSQGDYQVYYSDNTGNNNNYSNYIRKNTSGSAKQDKVSFFVKKNSSPKIQIKRCTGFSGSTPTWENVGAAKTLTVDRDSVYNYIFEQNGTGTTIDTVGHEYYSGNYYIRTDGAAGGWMNYLSNPDNKMKHTDKASALAAGYNYYYMRYIGDSDGNSTANVKFCIATDYNDCVSQEHANDPAGGSFPGEQNLTGKGANVRFTYHPGTNVTTRTCIGGSAHDSQYLVINGTNLQTSGGASWTGRTAMNDLNDWIYTYELKATDGATITLESHYNNRYVTVLSSKKVLDGGTGYYDLNIIYDYKTNEVVAAYIPSTVDESLSIDVDIMFIRQAKDNDPEADAPTTTLTLTGDGKITGDPKTLYGAIKFEKDFVRAEGSYAGLASHRPQRSTYWISFPFDVRVSDIFGLGDYTETWILQRYRGDLRASRGWFLETSSFWEYIFDTDYVLEAGQGYVLSIDCEAIQWPNSQTEQYLYFPSKDKISDISSVLPSASMDVPEYECKITTPADRTVKDSHWNVIGIPGFADAWGKATETVSVIGGDFHYFYAWDASTNTLSSESANKYNFKFMHSYMVQYHGNIDWSASEPAAVPARRAPNAKPEEVEFRLELMQGEKEADHTFITLMDKEQITTGFDMNTDLVKMFNANKANIYTVINTDVQAAANCLPMTEQTTLVPVGVQVKTDGEYTFAMPEGTHGVGATLIDNVANTRTNLGLTDYTVNLTAGTIDGRFMLEISPIAQTPTGIDNVQGEIDANGARKVMIDGLLYIVRGDRIYDATGALVK